MQYRMSSCGSEESEVASVTSVVPPFGSYVPEVASVALWRDLDPWYLGGCHWHVDP